MLNGIERILRIDDRLSAANIMRARVVYFTAIIVILTQFANQVSLFFIMGQITYIHAISVTACCLVFAMGLSLRWTKNFKAITISFSVVLIISIIFSALPMERLSFADGINTSMLPLLICGSIMCGMMYNWRAPLIYALVALVVIWGFYTLSSTYTRPDFILTPDVILFQFVRAMQATLALALASLITSYFSYRMYGLFDVLEANAESARHAEGLTAQYLADMSHEIRTPLNGIIGLSDLLAKTDIPAKEKEFVTIIRDCGHSLLSLINDVLDLSKLDAGKLSLQAECFDLKHLCTSLTALHNVQAQTKAVSLRLFYEDALPAEFMGDEGRLRQILNNLLSNAIKFTDYGQVDLIVKGTPAKSGDYTLNLYVRDTGMGIPEDQIATVFHRFEQVDRVATRKLSQQAHTKGSGLGLSIVKDMVEFMGGTIQVKSRVDQGTVFGLTLTLPLATSAPVLVTDTQTDVWPELSRIAPAA